VFDVDSIAERSTAGAEAPAKFRADFIKGLKKSPLGQRIGADLANTVKAGGSVRLLRVKSGREPKALFRVLSETGMNYVELYLARNSAGKIIIADAYVFLSGETISESVRRMYLMAAAEANMGLFDRLRGKEQEFLKHAPKLQQMTQASAAKDFMKVHQLFDSLPASLKKEKIFLLAKLQATLQQNDDARYKQVISEIEAAMPNDPALNLISIDGHFFAKRWGEALACIDRLDKEVNDPYLEFMRGAILLEKGDLPGAKARFQAAAKGDPALKEPYLALINVSLREKDFKSTVAHLDELEKNTELMLTELETAAEYAEFVRSKEYKAWKRKRG
jgi:hypothetical protein